MDYKGKTDMTCIKESNMGANNWNLSTKGPGGQDYLLRRVRNFGVSMIVLGICLALYYLGFFGSVEGPLSPGNLGEGLADMGISKSHILAVLFSFLIIAITWNWIYNLVSLLIGSRMTCNKTDTHGIQCGAPVKRGRVAHKKTGNVVSQYVCTHGHKRPEAHFHTVKKGTVSHTLWVISLLFCVIILCLS